MAINTISNSGTQPTPAPSQGGASAQASRTPVIVPDSAPQQQPKPEQVQKVVESLKQLVENKAPNSLQFSVDDSTGKTIVRITDAETGEMIRQIPSEELLAIARSLDKAQGMLLKQEV